MIGISLRESRWPEYVFWFLIWLSFNSTTREKKLACNFSSSPCWSWILTSYDDWFHYQRSSLLWESVESQVHSRHQVELIHTINRQRRTKKLIGFLYYFRRYPIPPAMFYIYKSQIRPTNGLLLPYLCWSCFICSFQTWQRPEAVKWPCRWCIIFHPTTSFPTDATLQAYRYSIIISMGSAQKNYASQFNQFKPLQILCTQRQNHLHSLCIPLVRRRFH